jgi:hypothetical protein
MIQTLLVMIIVGLLVARLVTAIYQKQQEGFRNFLGTVSQLGYAGGDDLADITDLEKPKPFRPMDNADIASAANGYPATPYLDYKEDGVVESDEEAEDDPRDLPWIATWSAADHFARKGQNCAVKYENDGPDGTMVVVTSKSCEAGMPHTRAGDRIFIPDSIPQPLYTEIMAHELVHIYQRRYQEEWAAFYQKHWAFVFHKHPPIAMPVSMKEARRSNPDTYYTGWPCWKGRFWPAPVYVDPQAPRLRQAITVWWDEWKNSVVKVAPDEWRAFFGQQPQDEHPHELAAVMIAAEDTTTEAGRRLMSWWRTEGTLMRARR